MDSRCAVSGTLPWLPLSPEPLCYVHYARHRQKMNERGTSEYPWDERWVQGGYDKMATMRGAIRQHGEGVPRRVRPWFLI